MPLTGTADVDALAQGRPTMPTLHTPPLALPGAEVVQVLYEMRRAGRETLVPPALHPTNPATLWVLAWHLPESPYGPFDAVHLRVGCRSGARTRGFVTVTALSGSPEAARHLADDWGFPVRPAEVAFGRRYDRVTLDVVADGRPVLAFEGVDPDPLGAQDLEYTASLNLAHTERGVRIVQVEARYEIHRAERLRPRNLTLDGAWWGNDLLRPAFPITASVAHADMKIPALRFVCRPDVPAHEGSEPLSTPRS